jgi:enamine deaminase RidA (YjgF/YER057c/UK114 family)
MTDMSDFIVTRKEAARAKAGSDIVLAGDLAFLSGLAPIDLNNDRAPLPEMVEAQTLRILQNAETLLKTVGMTRANLVQVRISLVSYPKFHQRVAEAYATFFPPDRLPARSCVGVSQLTRGALVEMDCIASRASGASS